MGCCCQRISNTSEEIDDTSARVKFENNWFAQGLFRLLFVGKFHGDSRREGKRCVVKVYKEEWYGDEEARSVDKRTNDKAQEMAQLFNANITTSKLIEFIKPEFTRVKILACLKILLCFSVEMIVKGILEGTRDWVSNVIPRNATIAVERYLEGNFIKFSSNTGYVNPESGASSSAFSHYTYHASDGKILVCGLQGIRGDTSYIFTSPAIHSGGTELGGYGPTDLGKFGIVKFFENHTCNEMCNKFNKPKLITDSPNDERFVNKIVNALPDDYCSSTYIPQLSTLTGVPLRKIKQAQSKLELEAFTEKSDDC